MDDPQHKGAPDPMRAAGGSELNSLERCREAIDEIDDALVALLDERVKVARAAAAIKRERRLPLRTPERECEVLRRVSRNDVTLSAESRRRIFRVVIEETVAAQVIETRPEAVHE